jgi:putative aminopeptidase FrvX
MKFLQDLIAVRGTSGDEGGIKKFILDYVNKNSKNWVTQPKIVEGKGFQDAFILVFGEPKTAIFAHTDTIGYTVGYENELIKIGGPRVIDGMELVGSDSHGEIETELMVIDNEDGSRAIKCVYDRNIDRGTPLSFRPNFIENDTFIQSPYLDNRLGCWNALKVAETLENGAIVFSTYEEHSGGSVGFLGTYLWKEYGVCQALISDITWVTPGVKHNGGVAVSMRDKGIPRRSYLNRVIDIAKKSNIPFQLEVESAGGSDGTMLQSSDLPFDWCFIGAPEDNVHSPSEKVYKSDLHAMVKLYQTLMVEL